VIGVLIILILFLVKAKAKSFNANYVVAITTLIVFITLILRLNDVYFLAAGNILYFNAFAGAIISALYVLTDILREKKPNIEVYLKYIILTFAIFESSWVLGMFILLLFYLDEDFVAIKNRSEILAVFSFVVLGLLESKANYNYLEITRCIVLSVLFVLALRNIKNIYINFAIAIFVMVSWNLLDVRMFYILPLIMLASSPLISDEINNVLKDKFPIYKKLSFQLSRWTNVTYSNTTNVVVEKKKDTKKIKAFPSRDVNALYSDFVEVAILFVIAILFLTWGYNI
jgi:hypothetical protein